MPALPSFWDLAYRAGDHVEHWDPPEVPAELAAAVGDGLVRRGQTALDIGCGVGCEAMFLASRGVRAIGVDGSRFAVSIARKRAREAGVEAVWMQGDATRLPVRDDLVDLALDRGCFHVIARRRRVRYAAEVARVLRPGGSLLLRGAREDDEEAGLIGFDSAEVERLFTPLGFECGPLAALRMASRAGDLAAWKVVLTRAA